MVPSDGPNQNHEHPEAAAIVANIPGVVFRFVSGPSGNRGLLFIGEGVEKLIGIPALPYETFFERLITQLAPEQRELFLTSIDAAVRERSLWSFEGALRFADGTRKWFHARSQPVASGEEVFFDGILLDVTENKRADAALRSSEANLQAIMANTTDIIASYDCKRRLVAHNQACCNAFRTMFKVELHPGLHLAEILPEPIRGFWDTNAARVLRGEAFVVEIELPISDGQLRVFESSYHPIHQGAEIVGFITTTRDITERKRVADALRESEKQFQTMFELAPYACTVSDFESRYVKVNQAFCRTMKLSAEEAIGRTPAELGIVVDESAHAKASADLARTGVTHLIEASITNKEQSFDLIYSSQIIEFAGKPAILSIVVDVSSMMLAQRALRQSEERLRLLLQNSNDILLVVDETATFVHVNGPLRSVLGFEREELLGANGFDLVHPDDLDGVTQSFNRALAEPGVPHQQEYRTRHKDGNWIWVEAVGCNLLADPAVKGIVLNIRDISARKKEEDERAKLLAQLIQAQKMESVGRLAGGVAHDFNNMLGVILGHTELAMEALDPSQPLYADLQEVQNAAERSAALTRQLLAFARKQTISPKVIAINDTVDGMLKMLRRLIGEDIQLVWIPGPNAGLVNIDPSQVDQILANLCVNARDAIAGTGRLTIETGRACFEDESGALHAGYIPGDYTLLAVTDDGSGMDAETRSHLFEPFFTTKEMGKGTGLGLATVFGIVRQNNGFINVYSEPGHGTTFKIYLPRHESECASRSLTPTKPQVSGRETILLVEDEPALRRVTMKMLRQLGYNALTANTPSEALRVAQEYQAPIDIVLTDVVMPEMNGRDLVKSLLCLHSEVKYLFMSGYTADVIVHHGVLDKDVHFLHKPFSTRTLAAKIREVLSQAPG